MSYFEQPVVSARLRAAERLLPTFSDKSKRDEALLAMIHAAVRFREFFESSHQIPILPEYRPKRQVPQIDRPEMPVAHERSRPPDPGQPNPEATPSIQPSR